MRKIERQGNLWYEIVIVREGIFWKNNSRVIFVYKQTQFPKSVLSFSKKLVNNWVKIFNFSKRFVVEVNCSKANTKFLKFVSLFIFPIQFGFSVTGALKKYIPGY